MRKPTQKQKVLSMLTAAGSWGLRSDVFLGHRIPRAAARINELRQDGYEISSEHEKQFVRYILLGDAGSGAGLPPARKGRVGASAASGDVGHRAGPISGSEAPAGVSQTEGTSPVSGDVGIGVGSAAGVSPAMAAPAANSDSGESPPSPPTEGEPPASLFELPRTPSAYDPYFEAA